MKATTILLVSLSTAAVAGLAGARAADAADQWHGRPPGQFPAGPPHGPAPAHGVQPGQGQRPPAGPPPQQPAPRAQGGRPYVDQRSNWVGHEGGPHDERYRVAHPWPHGRFAGPVGRGHVYRLSGWNAPRHRFWFGTSAFVIAEPDWGYADNWDWNNDQIVLYDDPDDEGWYLAYNARLGTYVHVTFDGSP
jgi:hypothetical protein